MYPLEHDVNCSDMICSISHVEGMGKRLRSETGDDRRRVPCAAEVEGLHWIWIMHGSSVLLCEICRLQVRTCSLATEKQEDDGICRDLIRRSKEAKAIGGVDAAYDL